MYLLYVDESGDVGRRPGSTPFFALSALVVHELRWKATLDAIITFRQDLRARYGLQFSEEIHAAEFIHHPGPLARIRKSLRLRLLRDVLRFEAGLPDINILNLIVDKDRKPPEYDPFEHAWRALIQRFHNTISYGNFPGPRNPDDRGLVVVDRTDERKLRRLTRRMRRYNPVPNTGGGGYRQLPLTTLVEDPTHRDSGHSYFLQLCDVNAYFLYQKELPCGYVRRKGARRYFNDLDAVLCKVASRTDPLGVVRL